jgi:hypothetical protein
VRAEYSVNDKLREIDVANEVSARVLEPITVPARHLRSSVLALT